MKIARIMIFILFAVGTLAGMLLGGATTAAKIEATFYFGFGYHADESLKKLNCPIILTGNEIGTIAVTLSNPHEKDIEPLFQVDIGNVGMFRTYRERMSIPPGGSQTLQWTVSRDDVVFRHLILVKLFQFSAFKTPTRDGACGIIYLDLPFRGTEVLIFSILTAILGMGAGMLLWTTQIKPKTDQTARVIRAMIAMSVSVLVTMTTGLLGIWMLSVLFFMVSLLLIAEVVRSFIVSD